jgi:hypothetical protein
MEPQDFKIHKIRIVKTPSGEASEWVRKAWVGLKIPIFGNQNLPTVSTSHVGVLSRKKQQSFMVYRVLAIEAFELLMNLEAEEWWYDNCPHLFEEGMLLTFKEDVCELV